MRQLKERKPASIQSALRIASTCALLATGLALLAAPTALAVGPPLVTESSFSEVTTASATLEAKVNPNSKKTLYHFEYITQAAWKADGESFGAGAKSAPSGELPEVNEALAVSAALAELTPATAYRFRLAAHNSKNEPPGSFSFGETLVFATYSEAPDFTGACPANEALRAPGSPSAPLPECRAYEQVSPVDKGGADVLGDLFHNQASPAGDAFIFQGDSGGISEGTEGSQDMQQYLSRREGAQWQTRGALPPLAYADHAQTGAWTEDLGPIFNTAQFLGNPQTSTMLASDPFSGYYHALFPYQAGAAFSFAGASADDSQIFFESSSALPVASGPAPVPGNPNLYRYDRDTDSLALASVLPGAEGDGAPLGGAFAGPYDWWSGNRTEGGAGAGYLTQAEHAVSESGEDAFFTAGGGDQLYERRGMGAQSPESLHVSASHRAVPDPTGQAPAAFMAASTDGSTAFFTSSQKLTDDANTGPEVPGPKIGRVTIGAPPEEAAEDPLPEFLKDHHAVGVAVSAEHVYWADPLDGTIGRAKLNGNSVEDVEDPFIEPGETCAETHPQTEPGIEHCAPSTPRYVALGPCAAGGECLYWTNTGPLGGDLNLKQRNEPARGAGTIGRAQLDGSEALVPASVKPEFIAGASNPQGIAVNASHIYWANSLHTEAGNGQDIARAAIDGSSVEQRFNELGNALVPFGVALSAARVYWTDETDGLKEGFVKSMPLEGGTYDAFFLGYNVEPRGIAIAGSHVYWAAQGTGAIGRVPTNFPPNGACSEAPICQPEYLKPGGSLAGLATDPSEEHLFWSANGEIPRHPGSDLYRFQAEGTGGCAEAGGCLADLTPDATDPNGAEVQGVLGAAHDGSVLYFVANAVLAHNVVENGAGPEEAQAGNCAHSGSGWSGSCNLYAWQAGSGGGGTTAFIARLDTSGGSSTSDARDWQPSSTPPNGVGGSKGMRSAMASADGQTLLFASHRPLSGYDNRATAATFGQADQCGLNDEGAHAAGAPCPEFYRYRLGQGGLSCLTCMPTGERPSGAPTLNSIGVPVKFFATQPFLQRNLSASGDRFFFESPDKLVAVDTNAEGGCPAAPTIAGGPSVPACQDVYEWEARGEGACTESSPGYSPLNGGCLYLLSTGKATAPAYFGDASASGADAFFYTRSRLVGQDSDDLRDAYDARVGGGLAAQYLPAGEECGSAEACRGGQGAQPQPPTPASATFQGPGNAHEKGCQKGEARRRGRCVKKQARHHHRHKKHARREGRAHR